MKVERLLGYFQALGQAASNNKQEKSVDSSNSDKNSEAVKLAPGLSSKVTDSETAARQEHLAEIKRAVNSGTYNADPLDVARAFLKEVIS